MMKLLAHLDRRLVPPEGTDARYLRVQLIAPDRPQATDRLPLNLALVLDRSGSMAGSKLDKAKEAAIFCLRNLTAAAWPWWPTTTRCGSWRPAAP